MWCLFRTWYIPSFFFFKYLLCDYLSFSSIANNFWTSSSHTSIRLLPSVLITISAAASYFTRLFSIRSAMNGTFLLFSITGRSWLSFTLSKIVSCGGGTPLRECNVVEMKKNGRVVLLTASPETIFDRVKDSHDRPVIENNKNVPLQTMFLNIRKYLFFRHP